MANLKEVRPDAIKITLTDGIERTLEFTLNAMAELEDKYGSVDKAFEALDNGSIKAVRCVLWAGLIHAEPNLTEQEVGNLIDIQYMQTIKANRLEKFTITISSDAIDETVVTDISTMVESAVGKTQLYIQVIDQEHNVSMMLRSKNHSIEIKKDLHVLVMV